MDPPDLTWTAKDEKAAEDLGWKLCNKHILRIIPHRISVPFDISLIIQRAEKGDALCKKALVILTHRRLTERN